jgi:glycosyltransferase involved in cell wall biosynthesis/CelD/BcsL family acetyltransferase involved in cellulose biosynthesis
VRILLISSELPWPPINGMRLLVQHLARELGARHEVCVLGYRWPEQLPEQLPGVETVAVEAPSLSGLARAAAAWRSAARREPLSVTLLTDGLREPLAQLLADRKYDVAHVASAMMAGTRPLIGSLPAVVCAEGWHLNLAAARELDPWAIRSLRRVEELRVRRFMARELPKFARVATVTEQDAAAIRALDPALDPVVIANGVDAVSFSPRQTDSSEPGRLVFTGALAYPPNVTAAKVLAERIFPLVRAQAPHARLSIVGRGPTPEVTQLADLDGVEVVGDVPDMATWLNRAQVYVCPMMSGTGIKNKLLEAMACARPAVATTLACQGIDVVSERHLLIADGEHAFAHSALRLLDDPDLRTRLGTSAREHVLERHSWGAVAGAYERLYEGAIARQSRSRSGARSPASMQIREPDDAVLREWDELASATGAPPFLRPGWILPWATEFAGGDLRIHAIRRGGELTAVVPLIARRGALRSPTNWETPVFGPVGRSSDEIAELLREVLRMGSFRRLDLRFLPVEEAGSRECIDEARAAGWRVLTRTAMRSPYLELGGQWSTYESARLPGDRRRELRRRLRKLEALGAVEWEAADGTERLDHLLGEGFRVEASGWKGGRGTAIVSRPSTERFYRAVARWASERGWLRLSFLRLDGQPLAFDLAFEENGAHYLIKTGFDEVYGKYNPGLLLRREMLKRSFERGLSTYEFLGHTMPWKLIWTDTCRERLVVQTFSASASGSAEWAAFRWARPAVQSGFGRLRALHADRRK